MTRQSNEMILFGSYTSPFVRHCRIELVDAGVDYEFSETDYRASDRGSPTKRVPYFQHGDVQLTDSSSILMYLRQRRNLPFIETMQEMEHYCLANTALDTAINLFLLKREGQTPANNAYLARQSERVNTTLQTLNEQLYAQAAPYSVAEVRTACLLGWGLYRNRFSLDGLDTLQAFLAQINGWPAFADTAPPAG